MNYRCLFAIAKTVESIPSNQQHFSWTGGYSYAILPGPQNKMYYSLFEKVEATKHGDQIPRYTEEDMFEMAERHFQDRITDKATFKELYATSTNRTLVPLEEHVFKRWHFHRIVTIGDSAVKVGLVSLFHPNYSQIIDGKPERERKSKQICRTKAYRENRSTPSVVREATAHLRWGQPS